eukprot:TRINITY_DN4877_c0_g1_i1.p1 TRINITY_DN4877_c0_g1~~TRINITY_DN4877_c0_g1_i1.p1  ORF type:complete len:2267 (-),score=655.09 TRINITY_DN4877_c0_g1_i1:39-5912(-)
MFIELTSSTGVHHNPQEVKIVTWQKGSIFGESLNMKRPEEGHAIIETWRGRSNGHQGTVHQITALRLCSKMVTIDENGAMIIWRKLDTKDENGALVKDEWGEEGIKQVREVSNGVLVCSRIKGGIGILVNQQGGNNEAEGNGWKWEEDKMEGSEEVQVNQIEVIIKRKSDQEEYWIVGIDGDRIILWTIKQQALQHKSQWKSRLVKIFTLESDVGNVNCLIVANNNDNNNNEVQCGYDFITGGEDGYVRIWKIASNPSLTSSTEETSKDKLSLVQISSFKAYTSNPGSTSAESKQELYIEQIAYASPGRFATVNYKHEVKVWECESGSFPNYREEGILSFEPTNRAGGMLTLRFCSLPDGGEILAIAKNRRVKIYAQGSSNDNVIAIESNANATAKKENEVTASSGYVQIVDLMMEGSGNYVDCFDFMNGVENMVVGSSERVLIYERSKKEGFKDWRREAMSRYRVLREYHPRVLMEYLMEGNFSKVTDILRHLNKCLTQHHEKMMEKQKQDKYKDENEKDDDDSTQVVAIERFPLDKLIEDAPTAEQSSSQSVEEPTPVVEEPKKEESMDLFDMLSFRSKYSRTPAATTPAAPVAVAPTATSKLFVANSFSTEDAGDLSNLLSQYTIEGLDGKEQMNLLSLIDSFAQTNSLARSLDDSGARFYFNFKMQKFLIRTRKIPASTPLNSQNFAWAFFSDSQDFLLDTILASNTTSSIASRMAGGSNSNLLVWNDIKKLGLGLWLKNPTQIKTLTETLAKNQFIKNKKPMESALFYLALNKKSALVALFKSVKDDKLLSFFSNDFNPLPNGKWGQWQGIAEANAYNCKGLHKYENAAIFFLLCGSVQSCLDVILNNLHDPFLAIWIARLVDLNQSNNNNNTNFGTSSNSSQEEGSSSFYGKHVLNLLSTEILPSAEAVGDVWIQCIIHWINKDYSKALQVLTKSSKSSQSMDLASFIATSKKFEPTTSTTVDKDWSSPVLAAKKSSEHSSNSSSNSNSKSKNEILSLQKSRAEFKLEKFEDEILNFAKNFKHGSSKTQGGEFKAVQYYMFEFLQTKIQIKEHMKNINNAKQIDSWRSEMKRKSVYGYMYGGQIVHAINRLKEEGLKQEEEKERFVERYLKGKIFGLLSGSILMEGEERGVEDWKEMKRVLKEKKLLEGREEEKKLEIKMELLCDEFEYYLKEYKIIENEDNNNNKREKGEELLIKISNLILNEIKLNKKNKNNNNVNKLINELWTIYEELIKEDNKMEEQLEEIKILILVYAIVTHFIQKEYEQYSDLLFYLKQGDLKNNEVILKIIQSYKTNKSNKNDKSNKNNKYYDDEEEGKNKTKTKNKRDEYADYVQLIINFIFINTFIRCLSNRQEKLQSAHPKLLIVDTFKSYLKKVETNYDKSLSSTIKPSTLEQITEDIDKMNTTTTTTFTPSKHNKNINNNNNNLIAIHNKIKEFIMENNKELSNRNELYKISIENISHVLFDIIHHLKPFNVNTNNNNANNNMKDTNKESNKESNQSTTYKYLDYKEIWTSKEKELVQSIAISSDNSMISIATPSSIREIIYNPNTSTFSILSPSSTSPPSGTPSDNYPSNSYSSSTTASPSHYKHSGGGTIASAAMQRAASAMSFSVVKKKPVVSTPSRSNLFSDHHSHHHPDSNNTTSNISNNSLNLNNNTPSAIPANEVVVTYLESHPHEKGYFLSGGIDGSITLYQYSALRSQLASFKTPKPASSHKSLRISKLHFTPSGAKFAATSLSGLLTLFRFHPSHISSSSLPLLSLPSHSSRTLDFSFLNHGGSLLLTSGVGVSGSGEVCLWDILSPKSKIWEWTETGEGGSAGERYGSVIYDEGTSRVYIGGKEGGIGVMDMRMRRMIGKVKGHGSNVKGMAMWRGGLVTGGAEGSVKIWKVGGEGNGVREMEERKDVHEKRTFMGMGGFFTRPLSTYGVMDVKVMNDVLYTCGSDGRVLLYDGAGAN